MVSVWQRCRKSMVVGGVWPELAVRHCECNEEGKSSFSHWRP